MSDMTKTINILLNIINTFMYNYILQYIHTYTNVCVCKYVE